MKETRRETYTADYAENQITQPQGCRFRTGQRVTLAIATVAGLALASGCATRHHTSACYSPPPSTAYAPAAETERTQTATTEQGDIVVPLHQETVTVGKREVDAGSVRLKKIVKTETINQPVELRREEIIIDRSNGTGEGAANKALAKAFTEEETVIPLRREEAVIQKQTVPAGEITVRRQQKTEQQNVQAQVRREDIDVGQLNQPGVTVNQSVRAGTIPAGGANTPGGTSTGSASSEQAQFITDPGTISDQNATQFNGRRVKFKHMKVQKVYGDRMYVVNSENGRPLYVVTSEPQPSALKEGDTVLITGKITQRGGTVTQSGLDEKGAQLLMQQPYYIQVEKIETAK